MKWILGQSPNSNKNLMSKKYKRWTNKIARRTNANISRSWKIAWASNIVIIPAIFFLWQEGKQPWTYITKRELQHINNAEQNDPMESTKADDTSIESNDYPKQMIADMAITHYSRR